MMIVRVCWDAAHFAADHSRLRRVNSLISCCVFYCSFIVSQTQLKRLSRLFVLILISLCDFSMMAAERIWRSEKNGNVSAFFIYLMTSNYTSVAHTSVSVTNSSKSRNMQRTERMSEKHENELKIILSSELVICVSKLISIHPWTP